MKESLQTTVRVEGLSDTKQKAFAAALSNVQRTVLKDTGNIILRIKPLDIQVVRSEKKVTKEKFLFFFFPREKQLYSVSLDISVDITMINIDKVDFKLIEKGSFSK